MPSVDLSISIVIPTFGRERVLLDTIRNHLVQADEVPQFDELIVIDQTPKHEPTTDQQLTEWHDQGRIRWIKCEDPHLTRSMNRGLLEARSDIVLFTDDDIVPGERWLVSHLQSHIEHPDVWGVVGQILQPGQRPDEIVYMPRGRQLRRFMDFPFNCNKSQYIENAMAGNFSLNRKRALELGGFDENFPPPVAARFESEFAKRLVKAGGSIYFDSRGSVEHLACSTGGTRASGSHLKSASPVFGVGDYYFALRIGTGFERFWYIFKKPFREVRTKYHLRHPWWIVAKLVGEVRAFAWALRLYFAGPKLLSMNQIENRKAHLAAHETSLL